MKRYALSAIGRDRPGIVAAITKVLFEHGCNIEDSSMSILEDEFAVILVMSAPDDTDQKALAKDLDTAGSALGLTVNLKEIEKKSSYRAPQSNYIITLHGADRAGIVYKTAEFLSERGMNITDLETKTIDGEAGKIYIMVMEVFSPGEERAEELQKGLDELGESLGVTIKIKPVEAYEPL